MIRLLILLLTLYAGAAVAAEAKLTQVSLQLKWLHQFQFAGYYAAQEKGFYRDVGLTVSFKEAQPGIETVDEVLLGKAEFGVGNSDLLLERSKGRPAVVLGVIFQHSPLALLALERSGIHNIHQLADHRLMIEPHAAELLAYLQREGLPASQYESIPHSFGTQPLIDGKVDAMSVYMTWEPFALKQAGLNYSIFSPRSAGIDFYGDNLFTSESYLSTHPKTVAAFREASLRGWEYAMDHPEEIAELIIAHYAPSKSRAQLLFEYEQMRPLLQPDLIAAGYMYAGRWRHIASVYAEMGMLPAEFPLDDFLYEPQILHVPLWVYWMAAFVLAFSLLIASVAGYIFKINRRLSQEIVHRKDIESSLRASEQHYRSLYETAPLALIEFDRQNRVLTWNHAAEDIFGWPELEIVGQGIDQLVPQSEVDYVKNVLAQAWRGEIVRGMNYNLTKNGKAILCRWSNVAQRDGNGNIVAVLSLAEDVTENQKMHDELEAANASLRVQIQQVESLQENLRQQALRDPLTNLYNRRFFHETLDLDLAQCEREERPLCLAMIDIDWFKQVNDTSGHQVGDRVLKLLADLLVSSTRTGDIACRYGGEEFVIVMPGVDQATGFARIESCRRAFAELVLQTDSREVRCSFSAGVANWPQHAATADLLLRKADMALYAAKQAGRNCTMVASEVVLVS